MKCKMQNAKIQKATEASLPRSCVLFASCLLHFALLLAGEQPLLPLDPPAIPRQAAILADHPVAGNDQADRVGRAGASNGAHRRRGANVARHLAIGTSLAVGDRL